MQITFFYNVPVSTLRCAVMVQLLLESLRLFFFVLQATYTLKIACLIVPVNGVSGRACYAMV